jgi:phospholipase C
MPRLITALAVASVASAASLADVKHVVMLMMENRSFQHVRPGSTPSDGRQADSRPGSTLEPWLVFVASQIPMCR